MSLRLIIERSTHAQQQSERLLESGDLSIGRGAECDWQLEDPDMFISRKHCVVSGRDGQFSVTDASRGGLFLDGKDTPLGAGVSAPIDNGMRLRLGDVVIRAELLATAAPPDPSRAAPLPSGFDADDFFAQRPPAAPRTPRPESLPQPFEGGPAPFAAASPPRREPLPLMDDPFSMDPLASPAAQPGARQPAALADFSFSFDDPAPSTPTPAYAPDPTVSRVRERVVPAAPVADDSWALEAEPARPAPPAPTSPTPAPEPAPVAPAPQPPAAAPATEAALIAAFFRGMGIEASTLPDGGTSAEMEALGKRFRLLTEGLLHLLRTRAKEKSSVRVAQTMIGASDVNPLKFLVTTEDALLALVKPRGRGYLEPNDAINAAFRDLSDHQLRTWTALQSSLRRMIDRFDPAIFETEVDEVGLVKSLIAGSRSARLWQLYAERYRDIAKSAEDRFLGDVGADFRDAYEGNRRTENDQET